jgi:transcription-repair coupling factor (superfamily II helicase)
VAALDLEIRGAGNLLGGEQSGHIEAVGFDVYMKLLEETIRELKARTSRTNAAPGEPALDLRIDDDYIPDMNQRLSAYRRMASVRRLDEVDALLDELRDRYGRRLLQSVTWRSTRASVSCPIGSVWRAWTARASAWC